jgi:hypothetical protein
MLRAFVVLALAAVLVGCESEAIVASDIRVEAGHGLTEFALLEDGGGIEMVLGSQGGWHIDLAAHVEGTPPDDHFLFYRVWNLDHTEQISYPIKAFANDSVIERDDGSFDQVGIRTVFAIEDPDEVRGRSWLVEVQLVVGPDVFVDTQIATVIDEVP